MPAYSVVDESETRVRLYLEKEKKRQPGLTKTGELRLIWAEAWREICFGFSFPLNQGLTLQPDLPLTQTDHGVQSPECFNGRCESSH